ncbi:WhiB family transcriptional regulator [Corynebacterium yudongzhengii]|uniref:Transcriptional regulator WhiB n=1 Tax=Corynebacterium yudongzhengii TaxID=2080740 RepID=A0A2U1T5E9_9CORY|nr:WhiB family transcriptional regulator [Corynebacterium yudongzhengii]AWB81077.1 WhiB family transcriptional regulator [Corynebacterium yudongzhengii]PWC01230.1 WhiB family transcriptional regulator [Corynebacterium yudongzhengii]
MTARVTPEYQQDSRVPEDYLRSQWVTRAHCRGGDPDVLFVRGAEQRGVAATVCRRCPVKTQCLADALDNRVEFGVWGGLTERQRRALLRANPEVRSWTHFLAHGGSVEALAK